MALKELRQYLKGLKEGSHIEVWESLKTRISGPEGVDYSRPDIREVPRCPECNGIAPLLVCTDCQGCDVCCTCLTPSRAWDLSPEQAPMLPAMRGWDSDDWGDR